jgi:hypothetical protein
MKAFMSAGHSVEVHGSSLKYNRTTMAGGGLGL